MQIGEITWEEFEKVGLRKKTKKKQKKKTGVEIAYIMRFSTIHQTRGYMVFECATKYMGATSQDALSLVSLVVEIEDENRL